MPVLLPEIVLASSSPRRRELLEAAGIAFEVFPAAIAEAMRDGEAAEAFVRRMAMEKAAAVAAKLRSPEAFVRRMAMEKAAKLRGAGEAAELRSGSQPERNAPGGGAERRPVVAADTVVMIQGRVLGKPGSAAEAAGMLRLLSGQTHEVLTGVCVLEPFPGGRRLVEAVRTEVRFAPLTEDEISAYVATGEPLDKAGAYAIQGRASRFVEWIAGCYFNVVGLPVPTLYRLLRQL